jgi:Flp pilus assembly protein TadG
MKPRQICRDTRGAAAVEFGLTAPMFFMFLFGIIESGLLMWTQTGLQHGAEMAARCASINTTICGDVSSIQTYAAQQAFGLNPPPTTFTVSSPACGKQVSASYTYQFIATYFGAPSLTLTAQSCFPA